MSVIKSNGRSVFLSKRTSLLRIMNEMAEVKRTNAIERMNDQPNKQNSNNKKSLNMEWGMRNKRNNTHKYSLVIQFSAESTIHYMANVFTHTHTHPYAYKIMHSMWANSCNFKYICFIFCTNVLFFLSFEILEWKVKLNKQYMYVQFR